jgi:hypothetical protein
MHLPLFFLPFPVVFVLCSAKSSSCFLVFFMLQLGCFHVPFWVVFFLADISHFCSFVLSVFSDTLVGFISRSGHGSCRSSVFFLYTVSYLFPPCPPPPAAFSPQEPVIYENITQGSRAQPGMEDSCWHRWEGHSAGGPCWDNMDQKYIGPTVTVNVDKHSSGSNCHIVTVDPRFWGTNVRF